MFEKKTKKRLENLSIFLQISFLISLLVIIYFIPNILITVYPGEAAVFWSRFFGGTETDKVYGEGWHYIFPWDKMYVYNVRYQAREHELEVLSKAGLTVHLYLSIRYAPEYDFLGLLHKRVGPDYVDIIIIPEVTSVLRETIGTMSAEEIYTTGRKVITIAINDAIEQVAQRYIKIDDVLIKRIDLPSVVADAIKFEIQQKHLVVAHQFIVDKEKIESDRKRIEAAGLRDHFRIIAEALPQGEVLRWKGIEATQRLAESTNAKIVLIGGSDGLPLILNAESPIAPQILPSNVAYNSEDTTTSSVDPTMTTSITTSQNMSQDSTTPLPSELPPTSVNLLEHIPVPIVPISQVPPPVTQ